MNMHRKRHPGSMLLIILALGAFLGACGAEQPTGQTVNTVSSVLTVGTPTTGLMTCTSCHPTTVADWMLTRHANVEPIGNLYSAGNPTLGQIANCTKRCHDLTGDGSGNSFTAGITGNVARPVVGCESCHSGGQMHVAGGGSGPIGFATTTAMVIGTTSTVQASAQFRTCTGCHELLDPNDPAGTVAATATHSTLAPAGNAYVITDTHFATPGDFSGNFDGSLGGNVKNSTGYAMDYSSETVCTDCHNPHRNADINREWAKSAHAEMYAGYNGDPSTEDPLGYFSSAWSHYNWSTPSSRQSCQRCHTTTGFVAYADALRTGNTTYARQINGGSVALLTPNNNFKPELLKCNGCHIDNKGSLRNPGAITAIYDYVSGGKTYAVDSFSYPDVKASNVCMACHTARESGQTIKGLNNPTLLSKGTITLFDFSKSGFINSHYLSAGGTVFTATGFEYDGRTYENPGTYRHIKIGSTAEPNTGSNGPCVGCHMSRPGKSGNHLFLPVTRSAVTPGHIEGIASEVCINCHTVSGAGGLEDLINERKVEYREAIEATISVLDKRGIYFRPASPYLFALRTKTGTATVAFNNATVTIPSTATVKDIETSLNPDYFKVNADGKYYRIRSVVTGSQLLLDEPYTGAPVGAGHEYTIIQLSTSSIRTRGTPTYTADVVQSSPTVTVAGALYSSGSVTLCPSTCSSSRPDYFKVVGFDESYKITKVTETGGNSILTLETNFAGLSNASSNYVIFKSTATGLQDWRTKAGSGIVPAAANDNDINGYTTGIYNMGAAFNLNLLEHDPGAYVHNRTYAKRLLYDAIDWADDNQLNYSVGLTLSTLVIDGGAPAWRVGAIKYLLPNGILGIAAERP